MTVNDLDNIYNIKEENSRIANREKFKYVLKYFYYLCQKNKIQYQLKEDLFDCFIANYQTLSQNDCQSEIDLFLKQQGIKKWSFLHEVLMCRFDNQTVSSLIKKDNDNTYVLKVAQTELKFKNADTYFKNTEAEKVFQKKLQGECLDRTLDLAKQIKNSKAIVASLPNLFSGGYYHAYLECADGTLIDPACNLVIEDKATKQLLNGQLIIKKTYEELQLMLPELLAVEGIENYDRPLLLQLTLLQEYKNLEEEEIFHPSQHRK